MQNFLNVFSQIILLGIFIYPKTIKKEVFYFFFDSKKSFCVLLVYHPLFFNF